MATTIYCGSCAHKKGYPRGSIRAGGKTPCEFCGEIDSIPVRQRTATGEIAVVQKQIGNYAYTSELLPDNPSEINKVREREARAQGRIS
jgi:hypothetical protein